MEEKKSDFQEQETSIVEVGEMNLDSTQLAEQLYNSAGLDPVVDAGLKDYDKQIEQENKLINKVFGPRGSDIRGYGQAVARRVAFAVYALLNKQYGGKVGDLRSYIMALEDERNRANMRYDELMGKVVGILGDEYKSLRTDSNAFMEKLTTIMGEDAKTSKINYSELAERLADIDGLRSQVKSLEQEQKQLTEKYEAQISNLKANYAGEKTKLDSQIAELEENKTTLTAELEQSRTDYNELKTGVSTLADSIPSENIGKPLGKELHAYVLKDSKVPDIVIEGVGKFIDFEKYLGAAVERGAQEVCKRMEQLISKAP
jgi:outer membrane murein-binding lipoprotein Lpp